MSISIKLMGVPGPEADGRGEVHPGHVRRLAADLRHARRQGQRAAADREPEERADLLLRQPAPTRTCSTASCRRCGSRRRAARSRRRTSAACRTCWARARRCSIRSGRRRSKRTPIPRLPLRPPDDYLRKAMVGALDEGDVELDFRMQLQTDPHLMPIENAGVLWPEKLSPRVSVATLRLPRQKFDSPAQMEFAKRLSYNPWHSIAEHRPLGNQSRARQRHVPGAVDAAPPDERRAALRADRRRDVRMTRSGSPYKFGAVLRSSTPTCGRPSSPLRGSRPSWSCLSARDGLLSLGGLGFLRRLGGLWAPSVAFAGLASFTALTALTSGAFGCRLALLLLGLERLALFAQGLLVVAGGLLGPFERRRGSPSRDEGAGRSCAAGGRPRRFEWAWTCSEME